jgi:intracellular sulfur oxidation DsrE/DsrF family protein
MKKTIALLLLVSFLTISATAQKKDHKIVFEITSADTADYRTVLRQINNVYKDAPNTKIEVVCHGPAIFMLVKDKTVLADMMQELKTKQQVVFAACANSMRKNNLSSDQLVTVATVVPNGVMETVAKQEDGWSYIKAGH